MGSVSHLSTSVSKLASENNGESKQFLTMTVEHHGHKVRRGSGLSQAGTSGSHHVDKILLNKQKKGEKEEEETNIESTPTKSKNSSVSTEVESDNEKSKNNDNSQTTTTNPHDKVPSES